MAKKDLTRNDGKPFNVRKVNGRWMFIPEVFGASSKDVPSELLLVPADMVPASVYSDNKTGYVPEDKIRAYINGPTFRKAAEQASASGAIGLGFSGTTLVTSKFNGKTAIDNANNLLKTFDVSARSAQAQAAAYKTSGKSSTTNLSSGAFSSGPMASKNPWDWLSTMVIQSSKNLAVKEVMSYADGTVKTRGDKEVFILADEKGKISPSKLLTPEGVAATYGGADEKRAAEVRKEFGMKGTGRLSLNEIDYIVGLHRAASWRNMVMAESNQINGRMPLTAKDMVGEFKKSGTGGPRTRITESVSSFSPEQASMLLDRFYKENIGRAPTAKEVSSFSKLLKAQAEKRPNISKTVSTTSGGVTRDKITQTAGFGSDEANVLAEKEAAKVTGRTGYVSATKYMDVIMSMIRNPVG